jgi:hypothetical protein
MFWFYSVSYDGDRWPEQKVKCKTEAEEFLKQELSAGIDYFWFLF